MKGQVIAAVKQEEMLREACISPCSMIFDLLPNIETVKKRAQLVRECGKLLFIHIDLAEGIGRDRAGLRFVKRMGVCGIISTRSSLIKAAKDEGLKTVQRLFIVDSHSMETAKDLLKTEPDMVEIMPGILPKQIAVLHRELTLPIIAGGLIQTEKEVREILEAGASAVSTSRRTLWSLGKM